MDKKDIYEHLAKIYLDASSKKKNRPKTFPLFFKHPIIFVVCAFVLAGGFFSVSKFLRRKHLNSEISLLLTNDAVKLNFHFDPAKKETFALSLNNLNLGRFKTLVFSARQIDYKNSVSLKVELVNSFKEKGELYIRDVPAKWNEYRINFSDFKGITDWSNMAQLSFIVEEWNARENRGVVYLDNIRFVK